VWPLRVTSGTPGSMQPHASRLAFIATFALFSACAPQQAETPPPVVASVVAPAVPHESDHPHELHLPPVGPAVRITLDGKSEEVALATVPLQGDSVAFLDLWRAAFPGVDPGPLHFDLVGSDGFHPMSRPKCTQLLTGAEVAAARIDVVTHNVSFDDALNLARCYRVKAVVSIDATR
jgi:hypothetical protein